MPAPSLVVQKPAQRRFRPGDKHAGRSKNAMLAWATAVKLSLPLFADPTQKKKAHSGEWAALVSGILLLWRIGSSAAATTGARSRAGRIRARIAAVWRAARARAARAAGARAARIRAR